MSRVAVSPYLLAFVLAKTLVAHAESPSAGEVGGPSILREPIPRERVPAEAPDPSTHERSWTDDWSILPGIFYSPETELGFGLAVIRSFAIPDKNQSISTIALGTVYTTKGQFMARLLPDLRIGDRAFVSAMLHYQSFPTRFFESGAHLGDDGEPFSEDTLMGNIDARLRLVGSLRAGLRWEYRHNTVTETVAGGVLERSGYPGLGTYFASGIGAAVSYDSRDEPRLPTRGILLELRAIAYSPGTGSDFDALRVDAELRGFLDLGKGHVLAGELHVQMTGGETPFQLLPRLGGPNHLRGWYEGHLRDRHALLVQLEWRFPIIGRVGGAAFMALGEAVSTLDDLSLQRVRAGGGLGLRYLLNERQNVTIRLDFAWGSGLGAYFDVLEAF